MFGSVTPLRHPQYNFTTVSSLNPVPMSCGSVFSADLCVLTALGRTAGWYDDDDDGGGGD